MALETRLLAYRAALVTQLKEAIPDLRDVTAHAGAFGLEAVQRFSQITPAAKVVFLNIRTPQRNSLGHIIGPALFAIYVICKDPMQGQAFGPVLDLAERVADWIELNDLGLSYAGVGRVREIEPIYSEDIDAAGIAVAAVLFQVELTIGRDRHAEDTAREHLSSLSSVPGNVTVAWNDEGDGDLML